MPNKLLIPTSCQVPNILCDKIMAEVSHAEFKVIMAIVRKTYGWGKNSDRISLSQLTKMTGVSNRKVIDSIRALDWIILTHKLPNGTTEYSINIDSKASEVSSQVESAGCELSSQPCEVSSQVACEVSSHTKPILLKPTKTKPNGDDFETFWKAYPKKRSRGQAEKAWKIQTKGVTLDHILTALEEQKDWPDWRKEGGKYIPYPATWLNGKRWEDEGATHTAPDEQDGPSMRVL